MPRLAAASFLAIPVAVVFVVWQLAPRQPIVTESSDNRDVLETIAAGIQAQSDALTPTKTPYLTSTPTETPEPPTETPLPTYNAASPETGVWIVPHWTETPVAASTVEPKGLPPCVTVTPRPYADVICGVQ